LTRKPRQFAVAFFRVYRQEALRELHAETRPMFEAAGMEVPHAQDLQNCLCEFFKYERARLGGSMPKRRFRPAGPVGGADGSGGAEETMAAE
jgi:hypothetical protein